MAMIACPGCGLPREDDCIDVVPCPVCTDGPALDPIAMTSPKPPTSDPVAGLPADVCQMMPHQHSGRPIARLAIVWAFLLGIAVGVGGILVVQRGRPVEERAEDQRLAITEFDSSMGPIERSPAVAPMPHLPSQTVSAVPSKSKVAQKSEARDASSARPDSPASATKVVIPLNQPEAAYTVPRPLKRGEHLVLRGKVRMLRINGLGPGAILDASELEAGSVYIGGRIEGGALLRISCPDGVVEVPAAVRGRSRLEIDAPGSSVRFIHPTTSETPGSRIDGGSSVFVTGRTVDLRGDVEGAGTSVAVTLTRNGSLRVAAVRAAAVVEYRVENALEPDPPASVATVEPTATFRKHSVR